MADAETDRGSGDKNGPGPFLRSISPRWDSWLRAAVSFTFGLVSAAFLMWGRARDVSDLLTWKSEVAARLDRMDREGTNRSKWTDDSQSGQIAASLGRISELERKSEQRGETINVMQGKIERMESEIKDLQDRSRK